MQRYSKKLEIKNIRTINAYQWAILTINQEIIGSKLGITKNIIKHIPMFCEMLDLHAKGEKWDYIYSHLGNKYHLDPSSVKRLRFTFLRETIV